MRICYLQHVPFEGPGCIADWASERNHEIRGAALFDGAAPPAIAEFDWLIVMGGPMGANDDVRCPWMAPERKLIAQAIESEKIVLGICLGAQLIAAAMGGRVYESRHREIGWFPVSETGACAGTVFGDFLGGAMEVLHWHGDTFDLPAGATHLARSRACENQAFALGDLVLGLQFHLEMTGDGALTLAQACADELTTGPFIQAADAICNNVHGFAECNRAMYSLLDSMARARSQRI